MRCKSGIVCSVLLSTPKRMREEQRGKEIDTKICKGLPVGLSEISLFSLSKRRLRSGLTAMYKYLHGEKMLAIKGLSNLEGGKKGVGVTDWKLKLDKFILEMKHEFQEERWLSREQSQT